MQKTIKQLIKYKEIRAWYDKYERLLLPGTLIFGVIVDSITFASINIGVAFSLLVVYLIIAASTIAFINVYDANLISREKSVFRYLRLIAPLIIQFTFGALLSASFIFYLFSGTLFVSWPFIILIVFLMIGNDLLRKHYAKPVIQISVYFFILFSLSSIILQYTWNIANVSMFVLSGSISLILILGYISLLSKSIPIIRQEKKKLIIIVSVIFAFMNMLYFLNIIPPIPLSLKDKVIAHNLNRNGNAYILEVEDQSFWQKIIPGQTFHKTPGGRVFVYTAIYAPRNLSTTIFHDWQYYDREGWATKDVLSFNINGGARDGYRGFSVKTNVQPGLWKVDVKNKRGQVLGRVNFEVGSAEGQLELKNIIK